MPRLRARHGELELEEMDVDAVIARAPELALIDELAHTHATGMRDEKRWQDIDGVLAAGIDVMSTVNVQRLESLNDRSSSSPRCATVRPFRTAARGGRGGPARRPDARGAAGAVAGGQGLQAGAGQGRARTLPRRRASALRELALARGRGGRRVAPDGADLEPLSRQAVREHVLALVEPQPKSQRIMRRAWRSTQRRGATMDTLWVRRPGRGQTDEEAVQVPALRRLAAILGAHFLVEEGDERVGSVHRVVAERGSTYVFVGTPDESRRREILGGSLLSRWCGSCPASTSAWSQPRRPRAGEE